MKLTKLSALLLAFCVAFSSTSFAATKKSNVKPKQAVTLKVKSAKKAVKPKTARKAVSTKKIVAKKKAVLNKKIATLAKANKSTKTTKSTGTRKYLQSGVASYYATMFVGRRTANGEIYSHDKLTAAHRTLPFGTYLEVTNQRNGRKVIVRVNDRGPYAKGRVIDLSKSAARKIGIVHSGLGRVKLSIISAQTAKLEQAAQ